LLAAVAVSFLAAAQPPAPAPPPDSAAPPPAPQYQVEILIFANREFDPSEERFSHELTANDIDAAATLRDVPVFDESTFGALQPGVPADAAAADTTGFGFRLLRPEELQLRAEYQKLGRIPAYAPLLHGGWVQPGLPEEQSQPIDLAWLGALNPRGSVRVYLTRFLHVNLDLMYQGAADTTATAASAASSELAELALAPRFKLVTERNVRSGELHYFDHPAFGVLVKVTPLPADATTSTGRRPAA
jgi:hypothetical protein